MPTATDEISATDRLLLAVVAGNDAEVAASELGLGGTDAEAATADVRQRLAAVVDQRRDAELTRAIKRLEKLYRNASNAKLFSEAVGVQKELNKLRGLYKTAAKPAGTGRAERELEAVDSHLRPLQLAGESAGTEELARLAVAEIVTARMRRAD